MFKKSLSMLLIILLIFSSAPIVTYANDSDFVINSGVLERYNGAGGTVVIPNGVTAIGEEVFSSFKSIISIKLPSSLTVIGDYAFQSCKSLTTITIPAGVKSIGIAAFAGCDSLAEVNVDKNSPYYISVSGILFDKNQSTILLYPAARKDSSYAIPDGVTTIGAYAFYHCNNLTSISIPDSVAEIEESAFDFCEQLSSISVPNSVKSIGESAFCGTAIAKVPFPDGIKSISDRAFSYCDNLTLVAIPDGITHIGNAAFQGCAGLTDVTVPDSVTSIGYEAFNSCPSLVSITIPSSVTSIGTGAFYLSDKVVVYGVNGSAAHEYAQKNYIKFAEQSNPSMVTQTQKQPTSTAFDAAGILNKLGLFNGVGTDSQGKPVFDLERVPTRQEALVMLIRLLGLEKTALSSNASNPFNDVAAWAAPYVGYAYSAGLTNGISQTKFGSNDLVTQQQYCVFLLRALGYSEKDNDFSYSNALDKAYTVGIAKSNDSRAFTRGKVTELSYNTLLLSPKDEVAKLANKLLWEDVFTTNQLNSTHDGRLMLAADMPDLIADGVIVYNLEDLHDLILLLMRNNQMGVGINAPGFSGNELEAVYNDIVKDYHWKAILSPSVTVRDNYIYPHIELSDYLKLEYYYENPDRYQKSYQFYRTDLIVYSGVTVSLAGWVQKVDGIVNENTEPSMSQKEKVKALHDYLVLNTKYDRAAEGKLSMSPHFANQVIFEGYGVCDGYAEAFKILMNAAGIECKVMYGNTPYGLHAWNQVRIDGAWYNIDVTWDDPDDGSKVNYDYFCVSDATFLKDHTTDEICKAASCPNSLKI